ncbi:MAG: hypothetical protein Q9182_000033 [Xanthomendoza sp. 2 TL-2023]
MASPGVAIITGENLTPVLQIVTWLLQSTSTLAIFVKLGIKAKVVQNVTRDDILLLVTLILSIAQCVGTSLQNANGFGRHRRELSDARVKAALKSQYAAQLLLILSLCCAKLSAAAFIRQLTPGKFHRRIALVLEIIILIWSLGPIAAAVCDIVYWNRTAHSTDPMFDQWPVILSTQSMLASSIIAACIPQFKRLLDLLNSGMLGTDDLRRRGQTGWYGYTGRSPDENQSSDPHLAKPVHTYYPFGKFLSKPSRTESYQSLLDGPRGIRMQTGLAPSRADRSSMKRQTGTGTI